jgi:hypothetical protein
VFRVPRLFSEYSSNNFQQCFIGERLVEVVGSNFLHRCSPHFGIGGRDRLTPIAYIASETLSKSEVLGEVGGAQPNFVALQYRAPPRWLRISIANGGLAGRLFWYLDW